MRGAVRCRRGANSLEFGLLVPFLFSLLAGIIDYAMYFSSQTGMVFAVREGTRIGAATAQTNDPEDKAIMAVVSELQAQGITAEATIQAVLSSDPYPTQTITVIASANWSPLIGLVPTPQKIGASWTMRMEDQPTVVVDTGL